MNTFKVGLLTLAAMACLVYMSLRITSGKSEFGSYVPYRAVVADASGLFEKTQIKVAGINAGRVTSIKLQGREALISFEVKDQIKITRESILKIKSVGFLGDKYLDIDIGSGTGDRLEASSYIKAIAGGGFDEIGKDASEVLRIVKEALNKDGENILRKIFENTKQVTRNLEEITSTLKRVTTGKEAKLDRIVDNLEQITTQLAYESNAKVEGSLAERLKKIGPVLEDVQVIVGDLKQGKGTLGKLLRDEYVVDQLSNTLSGVNRIVNRINNVTADIGVYGGLNTTGTSDVRMDVDLYTAPERFFRIGVAQNSFGPKDISEKSVTTTTGGVSETTRTLEESIESYKFNAQIGRRFNKFAVRIGLFESTGGMAVDYDFEKLNSRFSLEAFNYDKEFGPFVRLATEWKIWNVLYARVSGEDLVSSRPDAVSLTVSAGVRFTDRDIGSLLGFLAN